MKRFIYAFTLLALFTPSTMIAQYAGGSGTSEDPYQVSSAEHLDNVGDNLSSYFIQTADIDLDSYGTWTPIGTTFTGSYDGKGYSISNLALGDGNNTGLFAELASSGELKNIFLDDVTIDNSTRNGLNISTLVAYTEGTITNCHVYGILSVTGYNSDNIGGLAGNLKNGTISKSSFRGTITLGSSALESVAGLVGYAEGGSILNSYVYLTANFGGSIFAHAGGLVGYGEGLTITNSFVVSNEIKAIFHAGSVGGRLLSGFRNNVFFNEETSGMSESFGVGAPGLTTSEMKEKNSYSNWDFDATWAISDGATFPYLPVSNYRTGGPDIFGNEAWHMYGSPFESSTFSTFTDDLWTQGFTGADYTSGSPNLLVWNETAQDWDTPSSLSSSLSPGQGFLMHVYEDDDYGTSGTQGGFPKSILYQGEANSLPEAISLSYTNGSESGYDGLNLVANPSASTIDWGQVSRNNVADTYYVWDPDGGHYDTYQDGVGGTNGGSQYIAPFQGFWVQATSGGASFTVDSSSIASTDGTLYKQPDLVHSVLLHLENKDGRSDEVRLVIRNEDSEENNKLYDAPKLAPLSDHFLSLAVLRNSQALAIDSRPLEQTLSFDVSADAVNTSGLATLSLAENHLSADWSVELINTATGESYDLLEKSITLDIPVRQQKKSTRLIRPVKQVEKTSSVWQVKITTSPTDAEQNSLPTVFTLAQNFPNPFNPATLISYQLPVNSEVRLAVYDMLGRNVATLVNGQIAAGRHTVNFDASGLSSGVYLYRLVAGSQVMTRKLTVVK